MKLDFPIETVDIEVLQEELGGFIQSRISCSHLMVDGNNFSIDIKNVANYHVLNGHKILIHQYKNTNISSVNLFLNGSVLGAVLHQQGTLPFHGSSFECNGKGVIICGHSGTGKSSVTAAFCQYGAQFINDDITPVWINQTETTIRPMKTRIKLWDDSLQKLKIENDGLEKIRPELNKFYLSEQESFLTGQRLDHLFILGTHHKDEFVVNELIGMAKYNALRNQIYRKVYLKGMPETEKKYFKQLFMLAAKVKVISVVRPLICDIYETMRVIRKEITR